MRRPVRVVWSGPRMGWLAASKNSTEAGSLRTSPETLSEKLISPRLTNL